tara:strand:- start:81 stop:398 length:318 start_codon:yes stop_codon:yes gene_type:complete
LAWSATTIPKATELPVSATADHLDGDGIKSLINTHNAMAGIPQAWEDHGLRLTPIETNLKAVTDAHLLEGELAANEIHRTGRSPQIQGTPAHPFWPNKRANRPLL